MTVWIITGFVVIVVLRIVYLEVVCGRQRKEFLVKANAEIADLTARATTNYRKKFGRDPTAPFTTVDKP